ncbi:MAG: PIG-L family deacetylase [Bacteroidota bacterium]
MKNYFLIGVFLAIPIFNALFGQFPSYEPGEIQQKLKKLNVLGSVLYVAAHPDDENTRLITYYANDKLVRTAYLSATRGDGGQNLIGPEIRESLGVIRTQELLAARRTDGGKQFFTRANDFGYSKNPEETFTIWDREKVLSDFVWVFRKFRPDVVITRFNFEGRNHGHHTASTILAREAFELSGDPNAYPEQLSYVDPWQPKKMYWNTGWWWFRNSGADTTGLIQINVGDFNPLLGASYGEIAAKSRSMHKSQGFGSSGARGDQIEYLKQWNGARTKRPFDDIDTSWDRINGAEEVEFYINKAMKAYDPERPWTITESLVLARKSLSNLKDDFWRRIKEKELDELIIAVTGLYVSLSSDNDFYTPGDSIKVSLEAVNRSNVDISIDKVSFEGWMNPIELNTDLLEDKPLISVMNFLVPNSKSYSSPYWLREPSILGMYTIDNQEMIGKPENDPAFLSTVSIDVGGEKIDLAIPVLNRKTDPVKGEVVTPISVGPPVMMNMNASVLVFGDNQAKPVEVRVIAGNDNITGDLVLKLPDGWKSEPDKISFSLDRKGEEQVFPFHVVPSQKSSIGKLRAIAEIDGKTYDKGKIRIDYDHISTQTIYPDAEVKLVKVNLKKKGNLIGYIDGAGDAIPENLKQVGYEVVRLQKDDVETDKLSKYDAIILGIRAFNTVDWLSYKNEELFEYVKKGGTMVTQYNTSHRLVTQKIAPFDLKLSRDRVTVEQAPVQILVPDHKVMQSPNEITEDDFSGWVQERGLYFPSEWSDEFTPILSSKDPGESPKNGGLLVAKYGQGHYVYSGYSWFRELPGGVPGAYRIFVNLISLGND